jgi:hypothetical protein
MLKEKLGNGNGADTTLNGEHRVRAASPKIAADEIEDMLADRRRARLELSAGFCARCGKPIQNSDQFCSTCGLAVE